MNVFGWAHRYSTSSFSFDNLWAIAKPRVNSRIKSRLYVRCSTMYEKRCILSAGTGVKKKVPYGVGPVLWKSIILITRNVLSAEWMEFISFQ